MLGKLRWEPRWVKVCLCSCSIGGTLIAIGALLYILNGAETTLVTDVLLVLGMIASIPWLVIRLSQTTGLWGFAANLRKEIRR